MEGKEFRRLTGGIVQVQVDKDDEDFESGSDNGKNNTDDGPRMKDAVKDLEKFKEIVS